MGKFSLILGISPTRLSRLNQQLSSTEENEFRNMKIKVLERDNYTCQGCGMKVEKDEHESQQGLEVHHIDCDPKNNVSENLVTLCPLCHGTQHLGFFARRFQNEVHVIYCPEIEQADLNALVWTMAVVLELTEKNSDQKAAKWRANVVAMRNKLFARMQFPSNFFINPKCAEIWQQTQKSVGGGAIFLSQVLGTLMHSNYAIYNVRAKFLSHIRLFYDPLTYEKLVDGKQNKIVTTLAKTKGWQPYDEWVEQWGSVAQSVYQYISF